MNKENQIKIKDIFVFPKEVWKCSILGLTAFELNPEFKERIIDEIALTHLELKNPKGSVCYAYDSGLSPAYRDTYSRHDMICYILSFYKKLRIDTTKEVEFPKNAISFWKKVKEGKDFYIKLQELKAKE